ncbi:MAG: VCBS repeat-containing protein [Pseudomonadota bacterium]
MSWLVLFLSFLATSASALDLNTRLPDGDVARERTGDVRAAWYVGPTERYAHAVLGDGIEAAGLMVRDDNGDEQRIVLPPNAVFEDLTPRIVDLDDDGSSEIVTIRSTQSGGGAIAVYGLRNGRLIEIAATPEIGIRNRWLNPAGIADFDGDGVKEVAVVRTPHIGGTLQFWSFQNGRARKVAEQFGFSNHAIGSRALDLSFVADADGDGVDDLFLPDTRRQMIIAVSVKAGEVVRLKQVDLSSQITGNLTGSRRAKGIAIRVPTRAGDEIVKFDP